MKQLHSHTMVWTCLGRSPSEREGLVTRFASRAAHIEVTCAMETDSFIQALRRFMARRGKVRSINSDNWATSVGNDSKLRKAVEEVNQAQIR